jgi:type IV secretory pathway VirD2 relaxase
MNARGVKAAARHLRYIERDGVERDGNRSRLYGADEPACQRPEMFERPRAGERHQIRRMVPPEDAGELGLTDYVRRLMAQVERDLGRKLEWVAASGDEGAFVFLGQGGATGVAVGSSERPESTVSGRAQSTAR